MVASAPEIAQERSDRRQMILAVLFSCLGWAFDMFDLFVFLYTAPILASVFFGKGQPMLTLAGVYGAFTATLVMRPLGAVLFGRHADKHGRKGTMVITTMGIGVATALTGAIPGIATWGLAAPVLFIAVRLVHGVFMGGVVASTHTIGTESIPPKWRGLASGVITGGGSAIGKLLVSLLFVVLTWIFPAHVFEAIGWRFLFFSGLGSTLLSLLIFTGLEESPMWLKLSAQRASKAAPQRPLRELVTQGYLGILVVCILFTLSGSGQTFLTSGFLPTVMRVTDHVPDRTLGIILTFAAVAGGIASLLAGWLADRWGRKRAVTIFGIAALIFIPLFDLQFARVNSMWVLALLSIVLTALMTFTYAPILIMLNERFATSVRSSGTAIAWNVGYALGGSTTILVPLFSKTPADLPYGLAIATALLGVVYLVSIGLLGEPRGEMR
jgi:MFS transporter, MHS family, proline/betaine transporter